jgi:hypothetical protein
MSISVIDSLNREKVRGRSVSYKILFEAVSRRTAAFEAVVKVDENAEMNLDGVFQV